jgi:hypothetical protein
VYGSSLYGQWKQWALVVSLFFFLFSEIFKNW